MDSLGVTVVLALAVVVESPSEETEVVSKEDVLSELVVAPEVERPVVSELAVVVKPPVDDPDDVSAPPVVEMPVEST